MKTISYKGSIYVKVKSTAGYKGERVPVSPKGPEPDPKLKAAPFAKPGNHAPVAPVRKSVPSTLVPGKKTKK